MSVTNTNNDNLQSNNVSLQPKKRYKHWTEKDEAQLMDLIKTKKNIKDFKEEEWSEIAQKFDVAP